MEKHYSNRDLESYVNGFIKVSRILKSQNPDYLLAPITGAIPFIDTLAIIDRKFDYNSIQYVPSTSKFDNLIELMEDWYTNFIRSNYHTEKMKIVTIDEVVSGASALRTFDAIQKAIDNNAKEFTQEISGTTEDYEIIRKKMNKNIKNISIGIVETDRNRTRTNKRYNRLVNQKNIIEVPVNKIIPMDYPPLCPLKLKFNHKNEHNRPLYKPEIESFEVSKEYIQFLQDIARYIGLDPSTASPINVGKIANFKDFISEKYLSKD